MPSNFHKLNQNQINAIKNISPVPVPGQISLLIANSNETPHKAQIRLNLHPFKFSQNDVIEATQSDLDEYGEMLCLQLKQYAFVPLVECGKSEKLEINGVFSLANSYIRKGLYESLWHVFTFTIPYSDMQMLTLTLSCDMNYANTYLPIFTEIVNTLKF